MNQSPMDLKTNPREPLDKLKTYSVFQVLRANSPAKFKRIHYLRFQRLQILTHSIYIGVCAPFCKNGLCVGFSRPTSSPCWAAV